MPIPVTMNQDLRVYPNGYTRVEAKAGDTLELPDDVGKGLIAEGFARPVDAPAPSADELATAKAAQTERIEEAQNLHVEDDEAPARRRSRKTV